MTLGRGSHQSSPTLIPLVLGSSMVLGLLILGGEEKRGSTKFYTRSSRSRLVLELVADDAIRTIPLLALGPLKKLFNFIRQSGAVSEKTMFVGDLFGLAD